MRGFDTLWVHYGPGVLSTSNRNEYQEYFLGGKGGRSADINLTTLMCRLSWNLTASKSRPLKGCFLHDKTTSGTYLSKTDMLCFRKNLLTFKSSAVHLWPLALFQSEICGLNNCLFNSFNSIFNNLTLKIATLSSLLVHLNIKYTSTSVLSAFENRILCGA